jgi:hypothetical protein
VSTLEDRLRDAFRADAETVRPEAIPGPPAPPRRPAPRRPGLRQRRVLIPLAAAAAVIALVVGLAAAPPLLHGQEHQANPPGPGPFLPSGQPAVPHGPVPTPVLGTNASRGVLASAPAPGVPRFYVTAYFAPAGGVSYLVVRDSTTGRVASRINPRTGYFFAAIAAPAGDRTFVTPVESNTGCTSQLYRFRLNGQGRPGPLVPLHITVPGTYSETGDLAITPDGRTIAYATYLCDGEGEVGVIHLATRQVRVWRWTGFSTPMNLSLSADGRLLGYTMFPGRTRASGGAMILPTSAPAGSLAKHSRVLSHTALWSALSGDGTSLYYCTVSPYRGVPLPNVGTLTYGTLSLAGGGQHVIASWPDVSSPQCYASLDPAENYLLVQFPTSVPNSSGGWARTAVLGLRTGRLTGINAPAFYGPFDIAW